jgi:hypothetical protein
MSRLFQQPAFFYLSGETDTLQHPVAGLPSHIRPVPRKVVHPIVHNPGCSLSSSQYEREGFFCRLPCPVFWGRFNAPAMP